jgi:hypothetical protein
MDASFRAAQRLIVDAVPESVPLGAPGAPLEMTAARPEPPRVLASELLEGTALAATEVRGDPEVGFAAFLDGTQQSRVVHYHAGVPIVLGTVAAAVRQRVDRQLRTWMGAAGEGEEGARVRRDLYLPKALVPAALWSMAASRGFGPVDTLEPDESGGPPPVHPDALCERAVHLVQSSREALEQGLAAAWCATEREPLLVDGNINRDDRLATSPLAIGVVKSHRTLYVDAGALPVLFGLAGGCRTSVFLLTSPRRRTVASWYLRLRGASGRDPLWGLVRVEVALTETMRAQPALAAERADLVSRWLLAERMPLALPDGRWDRLMYGVAGVEAYLRAVV